jgi:chromosome segregation ATPase
MRNEYLSNSEEQRLMDNVRREMRQLLESSESRRLTAERESERRGELARENLQRAISDLSEKVTAMEKHIASIADLRSERDRMSTAVAAMQQAVGDMLKKLEDPDRRLTLLEEQRRQDTRRISEAETEIPELRKAIEGIRPKMALLEDLALRNERRVQELQESERQRREGVQQFIDQQNLLMQQRDKQIDDLLARYSEHDEAMQKNMERFEVWADTYRQMKRILDDFDRIAGRLEQRINEVAEMQRLSEERFRDEWNAWRDDDQKRWKQFTLSNDDVWRNHDKEFEQYLKRTAELEAALNPIQDAINRLWRLERERARLYSERYQALLLEYDTGKSLALTSTMPPVDGGPNGTP